MNISSILEKFDELIEEAKQSSKERETAKNGVLSPVTFFRLLSSTRVLLAYLVADKHDELLTEYLKIKTNPETIQGVLESARREFEFGLLNHPRILATADSMENLLEQAEYLLEQDYKDAACVIIGGTLESTLKSMLTNKYPLIEFLPNKGQSHLNQKLYTEAQAYDKATWRLIDSYGDLRNYSAHGQYEKYNKQQVKEFLDFTRRFISNWFAVKTNFM
jgi:hypothetical protein